MKIEKLQWNKNPMRQDLIDKINEIIEVLNSSQQVEKELDIGKECKHQYRDFGHPNGIKCDKCLEEKKEECEHKFTHRTEIKPGNTIEYCIHCYALVPSKEEKQIDVDKTVFDKMPDYKVELPDCACEWHKEEKIMSSVINPKTGQELNAVLVNADQPSKPSIREEVADIIFQNGYKSSKFVADDVLEFITNAIMKETNRQAKLAKKLGDTDYVKSVTLDEIKGLINNIKK